MDGTRSKIGTGTGSKEAEEAMETDGNEACGSRITGIAQVAKEAEQEQELVWPSASLRR